MTHDDVLTGYRRRLFTLADEIGVRPACRAMGVHHSTYYRLRKQVDRFGLEALNVRERRRPRMPNQIGPHLEQRIIAFALARPGFGRGGSPPSCDGPSGAEQGFRASPLSRTSWSARPRRPPKRACRSSSVRARSPARPRSAGGRRRVPLGPVGAQAFYFDLAAAAEVLPLTQAVLDAHDRGSARDALVALGTRTELDYELSRIPEQGRGAARLRRMIADTGRASAAVRARGRTSEERATQDDSGALGVSRRPATVPTRTP